MNEMAPEGATNADGVCRSFTSSWNTVTLKRSLRSIHSERMPASYDHTVSGSNAWLATGAVPRAFQPPDLKPRVALAKKFMSSSTSYLSATRGVNSFVLSFSGMPAATMLALLTRVAAVGAAISGLALAMNSTFFVSSV